MYLYLHITFTILTVFAGIPIAPVHSERILVAAFLSSKSHKIVYEPLLFELAKRGHQITLVTPHASGKTIQNIREIITVEMFYKNLPNYFEVKQNQTEVGPFTFAKLQEDMCRVTYDLPAVRSLLNETFDLVIVQPMFNECTFGFAHHFHAPLVFITPLSVPSFISVVTGAPSGYAFVPSFISPYSDKMSFYQRMVNIFLTYSWTLMQDFYFRPRIEAIYREKLGDPNIPSSDAISRNVSLILSNAHFTTGYPKPYMPDIIEVGGMHCRPALSLPKDLENFAQSSGSDGFIYFSMGSHLKEHTMPEKYRKIFVNTFAKLKQKILWKWETEEMPDLPKNIKLGKWLPQQDILGHPKIKLFITHGGLGSTVETVYHGVPILGIPIMGDQMLNIQQAEEKGYALKIEFTDLSEETLLAAINKLLHGESYRERVKHLSSVFRDQPDKPLDRAVFWTEYVLRHKGAAHMRSAARDLNFIQYHSIDVIGSYAALLSLIAFVLYKTLKFIICRVCRLVFKKGGVSVIKEKSKLM